MHDTSNRQQRSRTVLKQPHLLKSSVASASIISAQWLEIWYFSWRGCTGLLYILSCLLGSKQPWSRGSTMYQFAKKSHGTNEKALMVPSDRDTSSKNVGSFWRFDLQREFQKARKSPACITVYFSTNAGLFRVSSSATPKVMIADGWKISTTNVVGWRPKPFFTFNNSSKW